MTENLRRELLRYSEEFEAACILDAPTSAIGRSGSEFNSMRDCLEFTIQSAHYAIRNRIPGKTRLLNVSQGRSPQELLEWFEAVKGFNDRRLYGDRALTGWAMAGAMRLRFASQLPILIKLRDDGLIAPGARLHTLGTGHPEVALALTAVQDGLRETLAEDVLVSFDNATPFLLAGQYKKALGGASLTRQKLHVPVMPMPHGEDYVGSDMPWPCSSPFADRLTLGDLNVRRGHRQTTWDAYSHVLLAAHNVWVLCAAIAEANRRLRLFEGDAVSWLPGDLVEMTQVIREIFRSERPATLIDRNAALLDHLGSRSSNTTMIYDRGGLGR
ncbi:hypothetical protein [Aurantimonas sp. VKM B-3413]|uniref:hypothetical protein n=1 Tax=Aurantimonas sp. VKM B-3413 TaxID=2779401 RepID=UPI001E60326B|nr:hypothetical protein [Aurantimonas sp. VKM B-3413]MCB8837016.1 hypothetical protein [Aurantimonas sp. VKM B-3413]